MCEILSKEIFIYEEDYYTKMFFSLRELTLWLGVTVLEVSTSDDYTLSIIYFGQRYWAATREGKFNKPMDNIY